jgi:hypothetical protein
MTLAEFLNHTRKHGCLDKPLEGGNLSGIAIEIFNPKNGNVLKNSW